MFEDRGRICRASGARESEEREDRVHPLMPQRPGARFHALLPGRYPLGNGEGTVWEWEFAWAAYCLAFVVTDEKKEENPDILT